MSYHIRLIIPGTQGGHYLIETLSRVSSLTNESQALATVFQNLREGVCIATRDGEVLDANPAFLELFGALGIGELERAGARQLFDGASREDKVVQGFECDIR